MSKHLSQKGKDATRNERNQVESGYRITLLHLRTEPIRIVDFDVFFRSVSTRRLRVALTDILTAKNFTLEGEAFTMSEFAGLPFQILKGVTHKINWHLKHFKVPVCVSLNGYQELRQRKKTGKILTINTERRNRLASTDTEKTGTTPGTEYESTVSRMRRRPCRYEDPQ